MALAAAERSEGLSGRHLLLESALERDLKDKGRGKIYME
jgi:hypothetical protein